MTILSLELIHELHPRTDLNLGTVWSCNEKMATGLLTGSAGLTASVTYALTKDRGMSFGSSNKLKKQNGVGKADSGSVSLSTCRSFEWRPRDQTDISICGDFS